MHCARYTSLFSTLLTIAACGPPALSTPPPAASPASDVALSGAARLIGAGDIESCGSLSSIGTAVLVDSVLRADSIANVEDGVFTLGDNVPGPGTVAQFRDCFMRTWGDPNKRILPSLHPAPGNHEYDTPGADSYYKYFGSAAGALGEGYYSYDVGKWHVIVVNSVIIVDPAFTDSVRQAQMDWVDKDLQAHKRLCTIAYWHHPRFSSGWHASDRKLRPLWELLYSNDVDIVLSGHDHDYERFLALDPLGASDPVKGIVQIVVGTGGVEPRGFDEIIPTSAYRIEGRSGVLLLTLGASEYRSAFLEVGGRVWDQSGGKCH